MPASTTCPASAKSAASLSSATAIQNNELAAPHALLDCDITNGGSADVFDICVADMHEFFANGVLVHNCIDALRYAVGQYTMNGSAGQYVIGFNR